MRTPSYVCNASLTYFIIYIYIYIYNTSLYGILLEYTCVVWL